MNGAELQAWLLARGIEVYLANGRLNYRSATPPDEATLARVRDHRAALLELLEGLEASDLSHGQAALWFLWKLDPGEVAYNTAFAARLNPAVKTDVLERAVTELNTRHSALRSTFREEQGKPRRLGNGAAPRLTVSDAAGWPQARVDRTLAALADEPFDLATGPVARWHVLTNAGAERQSILLFAAHHIVVDFRSLEILVRDLDELYQAEAGARAAELPVLTSTWQEQVKAEQAWLESEAGRAAAAWWLRHLGGEVPRMELPTDLPRPARQQLAGSTKIFRLSDELASRLRGFASAEGVTPHVVLLSAFALLLSRYARQRDLAIGLPMLGRHREAWNDMTGYFVNPVVLRLTADEGESGRALMQRTRTAVLEAMEHHEYPFPLLVEALHPQRDPSRSALFQTAFVYEHRREMASGLVAEILWGGQRGAPFDLTLTAREEGQQLWLTWEYATALFRPDSVDRMQAHLATLLGNLMDAAGEPCRELGMLTAGDQLRLEQWNATAAPFPEAETVVDLLDAQAQRTPDAVAVEDGERTWSYQQLHHWAAELAARLQARGVGRNTVVGIALSRGAEAIGTMLAVMRVGGTALPLERDAPAERLRFMLEEAAAACIVTDEAGAGVLPATGIPTLRLGVAEPATPAAPPGADAPFAERCRPEDILYVLYTSGSTGKPKGVAMPHAALVNLMRWQNAEADLGRPARVLQYSPLTFDVSWQEILTTLANGGSLLIIDDLDRRDSRYLAAFLRKRRVERLFLPFVALHHLAEAAPGGLPDTLREVVTAGEQVHATPALRACFGRSRARLHNHYGPTEAHVVTALRLPEDPATWEALPSIGAPIANLQIHILDGERRRLPPGIPGELHIAGAGLARGYLGRPEATAERFVQHAEFGRIYKTGDLARWREGELEFLGRVDRQIKIHGYRVEPQEIEAVLARHPEVAEAAVVVFGEAENMRLAAYASPHHAGLQATGLAAALREYLRQQLPAYMVPATVTILASLPQTTTGKIDRGALPAPATAVADAVAAPPRTEVERLIANVWMALLPVEAPDIHANFFAVGGHSLLAARLLARIAQVLQVDLPLRTIFEHPTIAGLAEAVEQPRMGVAAETPMAPGREPTVAFGQQRLWFLDQLEGPSPAYHMPAAFSVAGPLAMEALRAALGGLVERHASLRSAFPSAAGVPRLEIIANYDPLTFTDLTDLAARAPAAAQAEAERLRTHHAALPFDLARGGLLRLQCIRFTPERHWLLFNTHHIISDGWSLGVLMRELGELYDAAREGRAPALPPLPVQYPDFAAWQRDRMDSAAQAAHLDFWRMQLAGVPPVLHLPADHPRPLRKSNRGGLLSRTIEKGPRRALRYFNATQGSTTFISLLAALNVLLWRYTGQTDLPVGIVSANRERAETDNLIGLLLNTQVARTQLDPAASFAATVQQVREFYLAAHAHRELPFEVLVEALKPERSLSYSPLFQVCCVLVHEDFDALPWPGIQCERLPEAETIAKFDLTLYIEELPGSLRLRWEYDADLFSPGRVGRMAGHFEQILKSALEAPDEAIATLPLLTRGEAGEQAAWSAGPVRELDWDHVVTAIEAAAAARPGQAAVASGQHRLTLGEWNAQANQMARHLQQRGVRPGEIVAVCLPRGIAAVVAILGVLKAGAAYLPLDPNYPVGRLEFILGDSEARLLVTDAAGAARLPGAAGQLCRMDAESAAIAAQPASNLPPQSSGDDCIYVIYTSGSTGQPKGAAVFHRGFANLLQWYGRALGLNATDKTLLTSALGFDLTQKNLFAPLLGGGCLYLPDDEHFDPATLVAEIAARGITHLNCTPSAFYPLTPEVGRLHTLRHVVLGGEPIHLDRLRGWLGDPRTRAQVYNTYGPTECTDICVAWSLGAEAGEELSPLGRPIDNVAVYLLDAAQQPVPAGNAGDLWIGGAGVGRGYLRRADLNATSFREIAVNGNLQRLYRSGDRARWRPDGVLEYLGRDDNQIKLRGFRIELGEIEAALRGLARVREAAVVVRGEGERQRLVGYLAANGLADGAALLADLETRLPAYMVPSQLVVLGQLPLTANGKVDRLALPDAPLESAAAELEGPAGATEHTVARIWCELLGAQGAPRHQTFFAAGGHSLLAVQLAARISTATGIELPLRVLYAGPTIAELSAWVDAQPRENLPRLAPRPEGAPLELSFAQQRLWFLDQLEGASATYNIPAELEIEGPLDEPSLRRALTHLAGRHPMLRLAVPAREGRPAPRLLPACEMLEYTDLGGLAPAAAEAGADRIMAAHAARPFDLAAGGLFRLHLVRTGARRYRLAVNLHHIISDGWSVDLLIRELGECYDAYHGGGQPALAPLTLTYADYAVWQRQTLEGAARQEQLDWWLGQLADAPEQLELPLDFARARSLDAAAGEVAFRIEAGVASAVAAVARAADGTLFMALLAAFNWLLYRSSGQADICIGTPVANRSRVELEGVAGLFLNTLALRTRIPAGASFNDLLAVVRATAQGAYSRQDVPFEYLVEQLRPQRSLGQHPIFQVMFNLVNTRSTAVRLEGCAVREVKREGGGPAKFDLSLALTPAPDGALEARFEYNSGLFAPETIQFLAECYQQLLGEAARRPAEPLRGLPLLSPAARARQAATPRRPAAAPAPPRDSSAVSIPGQFAQQARRHGERIAVRTHEAQLTYRELDQLARSLAAGILAADTVRGAAQPGVALLLPHGTAMPAGVLGVLMAGKYYVPLDSAHPDERLRQVLEESGADLIVSVGTLAARARELAGGAGAVIDLDALQHPPLEHFVPSAPDDLAYILYTSGTTGRPKGVVQNHRNVLHFMREYTGNLRITPRDRLLQVASYAFDAGVMDTFGALLSGAALYPVDLRRRSPEEVCGWIDGEAITVYHSTPTVLRLLAPGMETPPRGVRLVVLGGEEALRSDFELMRRKFGPDCQLVNGLGPTESTVTLQRFFTRDAAPVRRTLAAGFPVGGTEVFLEDADGARAELFGEIVIRSPYLALGYWRQPSTALRDDPERAGWRVYRTGDMARLLPDGALEWTGRRDAQVKLRGFRIELGEIESALREQPGVRAVAATLLPAAAEGGEARIVAYVAGDVTPAGLQAALRLRLPDYMVPQAIVVVANLPLLANGKLDRRSLPEPRIEAASAPGEGFATDIEARLAELWSELLGWPVRDPSANFFAIGGHSLMSARLVSRMREAFGAGVELRMVFDHPVLREQAEAIGKLGRREEKEEKIRRLGAGEAIPLSFAQERLWFLNQLGAEAGGATYSITAGLWLEGMPDEARLRSALLRLTERQSSLRMNFVETGGEARVVLRAAYDPLEVETAEGEDEQAWVERRAAEHAGRSFDLAADAMLRLALVRMSGGRGALLFSLHHIVGDGWSLGLLVKELGALYRGEELGELAIGYGDYAAWQRERVSGARREELLGYWRKQLAGAPEMLGLPTDRARPAVKSYRGGQIGWSLPAEVVGGLREVGVKAGATLYMTLLAGLQVVLARWSGESDIVVGSPVGQRERPETEAVAGLFVNTVAMRTQVRGEESFHHLLGRVRAMALEAWAHQELPFEQLVEELEPERSLSRSPVFQVMMALQNAPVEAVELGGVRTRMMEQAGETAKFDLLVSVSERGDGGLEGVWEYSRDLFEAATVARMGTHYGELLCGVAEDAARAVEDLPLMPVAEWRQLEAWNATDRPYEREAGLWELFARKAEAHPEGVALAWGESSSMSYGELAQRAEAVARQLRQRGVEPEQAVLLALERSAQLIVGMLGILRAGGAYVPVATDDPRLGVIAADSGARVVVTLGAQRAAVAGLGLEVVCLDEATAETAEIPATASHGGSLAYIMYTSGSTGRPKGVCVPQRAVGRLVRNADYCPIRREHRVAQLATATFDAATFEIWGALLNGAKLCLQTREQVLDAEGFLRRLRADSWDVVFLTTALFNRYAQMDAGAFGGLDYLLFGGEAVDVETVGAVLQAGGPQHLLHVYGPTECTTFATWHRVEQVAPDAVTVPIGKPIGNTRVWILDAKQRLQPVGVAGELYLGGDGLALGYLGQPEATSERFVEVAGLGRLYRSGDLGRWRADGAIEFLGRMDGQVKLRGFRIEPGEVEAALRALPGVAAAAVVVRGEGELRRLIGYVAGSFQNAATLREQLRGRLPEFMIPASIVTLDELPLNANGKVDRARLPEPDLTAAVAADSAPRTPVEELLAGIWSQVLGRGRVGRDDHFFECGGNSLVAIRAVSRMREAFGAGVELRMVFDHPVLREQAEAIGKLGRSEESEGKEEKIRRLGAGEAIPLSFAQERLWFLNQLGAEAGGATYSITAGLWLEGMPDEARLRSALLRLTERQSSLRMNFVETGGEARVVLRAAYDPLEVETAEGEDEQAWVERRAAEHAGRSFDLAADAMLRLALVRMSGGRGALLFSLHHIVGDGWSLGLLVKELGALYRGEELGELAIGYGDYAAWQRERVSGARREELLGYWRKQLAGAPEMLGLPTDRARPAVKSYRGGQIGWSLPAEVVGGLREVGVKAGATLYMTLLAGLQVVLARWSGESDIVVGSPVGQRERPETEAVAGLFVNTVAMRTQVRGEESFHHLLGRVRAMALEAWAHQELPFEQLVEELEPERSLSRSPVFQVMMALQNAPVEAVELGGVRTRMMEQAGETAKFDLLVSVSERGDGGLEGVWEYSRDLFEAATVARMGTHYGELLCGVAEDAARAVEDLPLMPVAEWRQLEAWNATDRPYEREAGLWELFARKAEAHPEGVALAWGESSSMSYGELAQRAEAVARQLRQRGVEPEQAVLLALERSAQLIVGMLGILRAGGAYVPVATDDPRLGVIAADSGARVVVTLGAQRAALAGLGLEVVCLDEATADTAEIPATASHGGSLAYIMYTSGSTGRPKGVCVPQRAVGRLVRNADYVRLSRSEVMLWFAPATFDAATFEIWGALLNGAKLAISPAGATLAELGGMVRRHQVTVLWLTAGLFQVAVDHYLEDLKGIQQLLAGGDVLSAPHVARALGELPGCSVINGYGPTENTTFTCCHVMTQWREGDGQVPIGKPIGNTRVWILDAKQRLQPVGVAGELYLGGDGLARGYLGQPEATSERFVEVAGLGRLYRSGDLGRWRADGAIEFLGRMDGQVKLRGFRIEPGEVEAGLCALPGVEAAAVVVWGKGERRRLVGYVAGNFAGPHAGVTLREQLRARLPEFMVPAHLVTLAELPLTPNGKLDRARLPEPDAAAADTGPALRTPTEELLAGIWADTLGCAVPHPADNFFDSGGNSLLVMRLIARIRAGLGREIPVELVFRAPTLRSLAAALERESQPDAGSAIPAIPRDRPLPLSFAQERLWFLHQLESDNPFYNTPLGLRIHGELDASALQGALQNLIERHEVLRAAIVNDEGQPRQIPVAGVRVRLQREDWRTLAPTAVEAALLERASEEARRPFTDLGQPPLLRALLLHLGVDDHALLLTMHHIVTDGWSLNVLHGDLIHFYNARRRGEPARLPPLPIQYADFAAWQREQLRGETLRKHLEYWKDHLRGAPPMLALPTDFPRPARQAFRGGSVRFHIDRETRDRLQRHGRARQATLFMTLLSAFAALLHRYSGQDDIVIGAPTANRARPEMEGLFGFFVNTLALRIPLAGAENFDALLQRVRRITLDAYAHQDLPFEKLVDEIQPERDLSRSPLFQAMMALQNAPFEKAAAEGLRLEPIAMQRQAALFDLVLDLWEGGDGLTGVLEYNRDLFEAATAENMARQFCTLLRAFAGDAELALRAAPLMDSAERDRVRGWSNGPARTYPVDQSYAAVFEERVRATPERIAAVAQGRQISYGALNRRANRIAAILREQGLRPNQPAGVLIPRGLDGLAAMLGVVKAGGMFAPLDASYPPERIRYMLRDSGCRFLLTNEAGWAALPADLAAVETLVMVSESAHLPPQPARATVAYEARRTMADEVNPTLANAGGDGLYLLYTSGSTGAPKGAVIRHDGALNHMFAEFRWLQMDATTAFLQSAPASSDISVWQCLAPLLLGGRTVFADYDTLCNPEELFGLIRRERVTLIELVPVVLEELIHFGESATEEASHLPDLAWAMATGEAVSPALVQRWLRRWPRVPLVNAYGPTEAADDICQHTLRQALDPRAATVPIGRPLDNLSVMVLDGQDQLAAPGVPGEICVSGIGVGAGYWGQPEKTAAAFVPNPQAEWAYGATLYRTGDRGRWRADGVLEFQGRADQQVKIRGFRVELGEIETALTAHPAVRDAVAAVYEDASGERRLAAYVQTGTAPGPAAALESEQVELWQALHDRSYGEASPSTATVRFNTVGWDSTYTGLPLPAAAMRECVANAVTRIGALRPRHLLEIGCGTGLLLFRLAERCARYLGMDLSGAVIEQLRAAQTGGKITGLERLELRQGAAHDFSAVAPGTLDTVVLNSVIQYFPSVHYFLQVMNAAAGRLAAGGAIFVGDIRSLALLPAYHTSVQEAKAADADTAAGLRAAIATQLRREQELALDPRLLVARGNLPRIAEVSLRPKRGRIHNEMTRFRYDAVLTVEGGPVRAACPAACSADWRDQPGTLAEIARGLQGKQPPYLLLRHVANARLTREARIQQWLLEAPPAATVGALRQWIDRQPAAVALDPEQVWRLERALPYQIEIFIEPEDAFACAVLFRRRDAAPVRVDLGAAAAAPALAELANNPLQETIGRRLAPELHAHLRERLPSHMIPAAIVVVDRFPLAPSGKIDRGALPRPDLAALRPDSPTQPRTPEEALVQTVWEEVLGVGAPGLTENFFALGGHSLKATQVASRLRQKNLNLTLRDIFTYPTIAELAAFAAAGQVAAAAAPIARIPDASDYPASPAQRRMWVLAQMGAAAAYNIAGGIVLNGRLEVAALQRTLDALRQRFEILRTAFVERGGELRQLVHPFNPAPCPLVDFSGEADPDEALRRYARAFAQTPHDLAGGSLARMAVARLGAERHALLFNLHHIISDGWSMDVLVAEWMRLYGAAAVPAEEVAAPRPLQYRDCEAWLAERHRERQNADQEYWRRQLTPPPAPLELPLDAPRPATKTYAGAARAVVVPEALGSQLRQLAQASGCSLAMVLTALVKVLLHRYSGQRDLCVGWPVAGRPHPELEPQIGLFVNTLALRSEVNGDESFDDYLKRFREIVLGALSHQEYPFDQMVQLANAPRDASRNPLFDVMVAVQNTDNTELRLPGLTIEPLPPDFESAQFDQLWSFTEIQERLHLQVRFNTDLFAAATMEAMLRHWAELAASAVAKPTSAIGRLALISAGERAQLIAPRTATPLASAEFAHLVAWFEAEAARHPERIALSEGERRLTYRELDHRANGVARAILRRLPNPNGEEFWVGMRMRRSLEQVIGILGILKAGGAYIPVDPEGPPERARLILEDAGVRLLLSDGGDGLAGNLAELAVTAEFASAQAVVESPGVELDAARAAYLIYTSGSTGGPKGCVVSHHNVVRLFNSTAAWFGFNASDVWTLFHSYAFDFSVWEIWGALLYGGRLVVVPYATSRDPEAVCDLLEREQVTVLNQTPSAFGPLAQALIARARAPRLALRYVIYGGERLAPALLRPWCERFGDQHPQLINMYGITETTVHVTYRPMTRADLQRAASPIGEPLPDLRLFILDPHLEPVPLGVPGELYVGGAGVARGYWRRDDLTRERFRDDPFQAGERLYRTGDRVRRTRDGELEYGGRLDRQLKIRGHRLELDEIAQAMRQLPGVRDTAVRVLEREGEPAIHAYYVSDAAKPADSLRRNLAQRLPEYMLPLSYTRLDHLPLTANGKLDENALPAPAATRAVRPDAARAARPGLEAQVVKIWRDLLQVEDLGPDDNVFDHGAQSLVAVQVRNRLQTELGRPIPIVQLFQHPTPATLAAALAIADAPEAPDANQQQGAARARKRKLAARAGKGSGAR